MHKYGESKTTRIVMETVRHFTAWAGRTKYQAAWFLLNRVYLICRWQWTLPEVPGLLFNYGGHLFFLPFRLFFHLCLAAIYRWAHRTSFFPEVVHLCLYFFCNTSHTFAHLIFNNVAYVTLKQLRYCCHPSILRWWYLFHFSAHFVVHLLLLIFPSLPLQCNLHISYPNSDKRM